MGDCPHCHCSKIVQFVTDVYLVNKLSLKAAGQICTHLHTVVLISANERIKLSL